MAKIIGYVKSFEKGTFYLKDAKGNIKILKAGDAIHEGELVYGAQTNASDAKIVIDVVMQGAGDLVIAGKGALHFDTSLLKGVFSHDDAVVYVNSVKDAMAKNGVHHKPSDDQNDNQEDDDETAAGNAVTDQERTSDVFDVRDGLTQDVTTALSSSSTTATDLSSVTLSREDTADTTPPTDSAVNVINDAPTVVVTVTATPVENSAAAGDPVATSAGYDEDGDTLVYSLTNNPGGVYAIDPDTGDVTLTQAGADLVNGGGDLPAVEVTVTDPAGATGNDSENVAATKQTNDAPTITITAQNDFTEDAAGNAVGSVVASYTTYDEDGDTVTVTLSDTTNYALDGSGNVVLTAEGLALVNSGADLPAFTLTPNDGTVDGTPAEVDPSVTPVADTPLFDQLADIVTLHEGATVISTGSRDITVTKYDMGAGVTQSNLETELGVAAGSLDNRFDPTGVNANDPGFVDIIDGKLTESSYNLASGMSVSWDYIFSNGENLLKEVEKGFNDQVVLVVTDPSGAKTYIQVDSSEQKFPDAIYNGSYTFTATEDGTYTFDWLVLNSGDNWKDSSLSLSGATFRLNGSSTDYSTPIALAALASSIALADTDGSETLSVTISGIPGGGALSAGTDNGDGSWTLTEAQLENLYILPPEGYTGTMTLSVTATATEASNGDTASTSQTFDITVNETTSTVTTGSQTSQTLNGTSANDLMRGYAGDDIMNGGDGNDVIYGGAGNDTLNGGAGSDALYGGVGNDTLIFDARDVVIDGGTGTDSLVLLSGDNIDFSTLDSSKISNIETIDLTQNGDHSITNLTLQDVINMTDGNNTLTITGESGDSINLPVASGDYHVTVDSTTETGFDVYTYTSSNAADPTVVLKVDQDVTPA